MADKLVDDLKRALGDAYTIERELTGGGMSRVFVAKEHALGREVVIKVLPPDLAAGVNRERFRREVQLAARLSHPYIVPLLHAGEHGELLWFTMPYIAGESLRTRLLRTGALKLPEALKLLHDVVEALAYAYSRGVVHRDIKPGNILSDGRHALVTDFGVAKALNAALPMGGPGHTTSGMAIGTPAYMAPEQLAADPEADHRVDIYAVGLLAYELLSGVSPFAAPSPTATMTAQLTRVPQALHELHSDIPPAFSALVQHCLAKSPEDRPPDAQSVLAELDRISGALAADVHRSTSGETNAKARASSLPLVFATVGVLLLVAGGVWWTQRGTPKAASGTDTTSTRLGTDTELNAPLPAKPMTHKDSLKLLEDLRAQLGQADVRPASKPTVNAAVAESISLDRQLARADSLFRARLREFYAAQAAGARGTAPTGTTITVVAPPAAIPGSPGTAVAIGQVPTIAGSAAPQRLRIMATSRDRDTLLMRLQRRAALDLVERSNRGVGQWASVTIDSGASGGPGGFGGDAGRGRGNGGGNNRSAAGSIAGLSDADVFVILSMRHEGTDSVKMSIFIRRTDPNSNLGYSQVNSDPVYRPTSTAPFNSTLNDAARLLRQLRQLQPGQVWVQDMGRGGRGGPFDPGALPMRTFTPQQLDAMTKGLETARKVADSFKNKTPPRRRDSTP